MTQERQPKLVQSESGVAIQAVSLPYTGMTKTITSVVGSASTAQILSAGLYRIFSPIEAYICAGSTAAGTDMPIAANSVEYFYLDGTSKLAAFCAAGSTISATLI